MHSGVSSHFAQLSQVAADLGKVEALLRATYRLDLDARMETGSHASYWCVAPIGGLVPTESVRMMLGVNLDMSDGFLPWLGHIVFSCGGFKHSLRTLDPEEGIVGRWVFETSPFLPEPSLEPRIDLPEPIRRLEQNLAWKSLPRPGHADFDQQDLLKIVGVMAEIFNQFHVP